MNIEQFKFILLGVSITASISVTANVDLGSGPKDSLIAQTNCSDIQLTNIMTGYMGRYSFKAGFNIEEKSAFIKRKKSKVSNKCILPSLKSRQIAYIEVDTDSFRASGAQGGWTLQCIRSDKPNEGLLTKKEDPKEATHNVNYLSAKDMMLHCGHSQKDIKECGKGTSSDLIGQWNRKLVSSGKTMLSVKAETSSLAPAGGEKLYCEYNNRFTDQSLFAFEYEREKK